MAWKGVRKGNFKNRSVERVHKWKAGDLLMFNDHCPTGKPRWGNVEHLIDKHKTALVLSVDNVNRSDPSGWRQSTEDYSYFPEYKTNAKYKEIVIQLGTIKHSMWINDNAVCDTFIPCLGTQEQIASDKGRVDSRKESCLSIAHKVEKAVNAIESVVLANAQCFASLTHDDVFKNQSKTKNAIRDKFKNRFHWVDNLEHSRHYHDRGLGLDKFQLQADGSLAYVFKLKPLMEQWALPSDDEIELYREYYKPDEYDHDVPDKYMLSPDFDIYERRTGYTQNSIEGKVCFEFDEGGWNLLYLRLVDNHTHLNERKFGHLKQHRLTGWRLIQCDYIFEGGKWIPYKVKQ